MWKASGRAPGAGPFLSTVGMRHQSGKRSLPELRAKQQSPILHPASPAPRHSRLPSSNICSLRGGEGRAGRTSRALRLTSWPLASNHTHPNTEPSILVFFPAGSRPAFGDIKRWRRNRCPWERVPVANRPRKQNHVPASSLEIAWLQLAAPGSPPAALCQIKGSPSLTSVFSL